MKPGSTVICINDQFSEEALQRLNVFPKKGFSYIIKDIVPDPLGKLPPGLVLEGLSNPIGWVACKSGLVLVEYSFRANRFQTQPKKQEPWNNSELQLHKPLALPSIKN